MTNIALHQWSNSPQEPGQRGLEWGKTKEPGQLKVLLAEDNPMDVKLVSILLFQQDLKLQLAQNGREAIEKIKENYFDIVLMDIEMPVMNGYEATSVIRDQLKSNVPIIAMTANSRNSEKEKCLKLGMNNYITKPIDEPVLFSMMYELIFGHINSKNEEPAERSERPIPGKVYDLDYLLTAVRGNKKVVHDIINIFLEETPGELVELQAAIEKADPQVTRGITHKLRSSFSLLGIHILIPILEEMELLSNYATPFGKMEQLIRSVNIIFDKVKTEMESDKIILA
ncbi:MAG: response regulator [Ferruginibacter sp.]